PRCNLLPLTPVPSTAIYQHSHTRDLHSFPTRRSSDLRTARCPELVLRDHTVDDAVLLRLVGAHEVVALGVLLHLLDVLPGVLGDDLIQPAAHVDDLPGMDFDIGRLPLKA